MPLRKSASRLIDRRGQRRPRRSATVDPAPASAARTKAPGPRPDWAAILHGRDEHAAHPA